jgi:hypothetical protein
MKLNDLKDSITDARHAALKDARAEWTFRYIRSRGMFLSTIGKNGQCQPKPSAECPTWHGTLREITDLVSLVETTYPEVTEILIEGGYDGADSLRAYLDDDYQPWVAAWSVTVWRRPEC